MNRLLGDAHWAIMEAVFPFKKQQISGPQLQFVDCRGLLGVCKMASLRASERVQEPFEGCYKTIFRSHASASVGAKKQPFCYVYVSV